MNYNFNNIAKLNFDLFNDTKYSVEKIYSALFGGIPNKRIIQQKFDTYKIAEFIKQKFKIEERNGQIRSFNVIHEKKDKSDDEYGETIMVIHRNDMYDSHFMVLIEDGLMFSFTNNSFTSLYSDDIEETQIIKLEKEIKKFKKNEKKKKSFFYMIVKGYEGFDLNEYKVNDTKTDINLHYNDDFKAFDNDVKGFLKDDNRNGMILMHGASGTGKTSYIRHLIRNIQQKFIFLPLFMAESLSSPDLLPFLSEQKNSILIIEDSEKLIKSRESGNVQNDIATLLNMSDGLLSDALGIKLICTFNTGLEKIDKALLRKGRMVNRYEFKELGIEKATKLAKKHNLNFNKKAPITLGNLFNIDKENVTGEVNEKHIGF